MSRRVFGIDFSPLTAVEIASLVTQTERPDTFRLLVTANLDHVAQLSTNRRFRAAYDGAWIATIDGMPVHLYSRLRGTGARERVPGSDLLPLILEWLRPGTHRPFFVAANSVVAAALTARLMTRGFDPADVATAVPPLGFECDAGASAALVAAIASHGSTHLFLGVGAPKSEIWVHENRAGLGATYAFCFGAGLDYAAGTRRRAPRLLRRIGMEWAWRVASEPRRLFVRYFVRSWGFLQAVAADLLMPSTRQ